ncbi:MAG: hypothetical protein NDI61_04165 [Bdellovibrionaceae bacterium]|nr:hypothetical protein [Pseudobdellovibrionaceae bacterium]
MTEANDPNAVPSGDPRSRRKVKNLIQKPKQQLKYIMYFLATGMMLLLIVFSFVLFTLSNLVNTMTQLCGMGEDVQAAVQQSIMSAWVVFGIVFVAFAAMSVATGLLISHRIYGAMVPIRRQAEAILAGDYKARGKLREHDELQDIMTDLNTIAEKLDSKYGSQP